MKIPGSEESKLNSKNVFFIELIFYKIILIRKRHFNTFRKVFTLILDSWAGLVGF